MSYRQRDSMEQETPSDNTVSNGHTALRVFPYRWVILAIFCFSCFINFLQFLQFSIIANIIKRYYLDVDSFLVDLAGLIFFVVFIIGFLPISYLIERFNLKITAIVSSGLTLVGILLKLLCADPSRFYMALLGQALVATGQVYMFSTPSKVASVWFGPEEVSTACAIALLGMQLGVAVGCVVPLMVPNGTKDEITDKIFEMMIYNSVVAAVAFIIVIFFFRAKPKCPPSQSQLNLSEMVEREPFLTSFKKLIRNKDYVLIVISLAVSNGIWTSFGILLNTMYMEYFPGSENDVGTIAMLAILSGGCIATVIFGYILDKTHQFKRVSFGILLASGISFIFVLLTFYFKLKLATYFSVPIFGFFLAPTLIVGFEYALEVTYPIPESVSCSVFNAFIYLFAIIFTLVIEGLLDAIGNIATFIMIAAAMFICSGSVIFISSSNLRRREANLGQ